MSVKGYIKCAHKMGLRLSGQQYTFVGSSIYNWTSVELADLTWILKSMQD